MKPWRGWLLPTLILASDLAAIFISFLLAYWVRFHSGLILPWKGIPHLKFYLQAAGAVSILWGTLLTREGLYRNRVLDGFDEFLKVVKSAFLGTVVLMAVIFLYRNFSYSRIVIPLACGFSTLFIFIFRRALYFGLRLFAFQIFPRLFRKRRILLLGGGKAAARLGSFLEKQTDVEVLSSPAGISPKTLLQRIREENLAEVVATGAMEHVHLLSLAQACDIAEIDFKFVPEIAELRLGELIVDDSVGIPVFHLKALPLDGANAILKRAVDVLAATLFLCLFSAPLLLILILLKLENQGGVFFRQRRVGYQGRAFGFLKFRTMVKGADGLIGDLKHLSERAGPVFKMREDPRITPLGKILRRTSLDELPQLLNVLKGEMSLVGPRPQVLWEAAHYDEVAKKRLRVLPGITGLWQVSGRGDISYEEMIQLDLFYVENWSFGLDLKILLKTIPAILSGRGAY